MKRITAAIAGTAWIFAGMIPATWWAFQRAKFWWIELGMEPFAADYFSGMFAIYCGLAQVVVVVVIIANCKGGRP